VPKDQQDAIWQRFKAAADAIYERKRKASAEMRRVLEENMKSKQELCIKIEPFAEYNSDRITDWNAKTKEIMALQAEWEKIGPAPKEVAKDINKQFWSNFKQFFAAKGRFFDQLEKSRQENLSQKIELCLQAEALKDNSDWDAVTATLKKLQEQWKKIGSVPESQREAVYQRFKAACDYFFERKRNRSQAQEKEFDTNLAKKRTICEQIEALAAAKETDLAKLEELHKAFLAIGFVPRNQIEKITDRLENAITSFLKNLDMPEEEREKIKFRLQMQSLEGNPDAGRIIAKQEQALRKKIAAMENDISLWKNNLDFFANSKTADKLRRDFQMKIDAAESHLDKLRSQLRALVNTVNKK
jgi:quinol monooxygenase YgiN